MAAENQNSKSWSNSRNVLQEFRAACRIYGYDAEADLRGKSEWRHCLYRTASIHQGESPESLRFPFSLVNSQQKPEEFISIDRRVATWSDWNQAWWHHAHDDHHHHHHHHHHSSSSSRSLDLAHHRPRQHFPDAQLCHTGTSEAAIQHLRRQGPWGCDFFCSVLFLCCLMASQPLPPVLRTLCIPIQIGPSLEGPGGAP